MDTVSAKSERERESETVSGLWNAYSEKNTTNSMEDGKTTDKYVLEKCDRSSDFIIVIIDVSFFSSLLLLAGVIWFVTGHVTAVATEVEGNVSILLSEQGELSSIDKLSSAANSDAIRLSKASSVTSNLF